MSLSLGRAADRLQVGSVRFSSGLRYMPRHVELRFLNQFRSIFFTGFDHALMGAAGQGRHRPDVSGPFYFSSDLGGAGFFGAWSHCGYLPFFSERASAGRIGFFLSRLDFRPHSL